MIFNKNISGKKYTAADEQAMLYTLRSDGLFAGVSASTNFSGSNIETVALTGWQQVSPRGTLMSQVVSGKYIDLTDGWRATGDVLTYSASAAQKYINQVISNNKIILCNNLLCARFAHHLTATEKQTLYDLQTRLEERNNSLVNDGMVSGVETSSPVGYAAFETYLQAYMQKGVGLVLTTGAVIVISAIVLASLTTAAYFAYKAYAAESENDVHFSDELTATLLSKLTPEEYRLLEQETAGLITKAKLQARLGSSLSIAKALLWGVGLFAAGWAVKRIVK